MAVFDALIVAMLVLLATLEMHVGDGPTAAPVLKAYDDDDNVISEGCSLLQGGERGENGG